MLEEGIGILGLEAGFEHPLGLTARADQAQLDRESTRVYLGGALAGDPVWAPTGLRREGVVRDPGLATIGGGNHFVEVRELFGDVEAPLVYDVPHNITLPWEGGWLARKGACPAEAEQPVIIPGSMGAESYLMVGRGNARALASASHGAGRARSRFSMARGGADKREEALGLTGVDCIALRYKPIGPVIASQVEADIVQEVARLRPLMTFKA